MAGKNGGARPGAGATPLLTKPVLERLLLALDTSYFLETAAASIGITSKTLRRWIKRGEKATRYNLNGKYGIYAELYVRSGEVLAKKEGKFATMIAGHGERDWRALAHLLACMSPDKWGNLGDRLAKMEKQLNELLKGQQ
jgi:hypothetical protein